MNLRKAEILLAVLLAGTVVTTVPQAFAATTLYAYDVVRGFGSSVPGVSTTEGKAEYKADSGTITVRFDEPSTAYHEVWVLPGTYIHSSAEFGKLKAFSRTSAYLNERLNYNLQGYEGVSAGFSDTVVFNTGQPGEAGVAKFLINLDGVFSTSDHTRSNYGNPVPMAGFFAETFYYLRGIDYDVSGVRTGPNSVTNVSSSRIYSVNFTSGVPVDIGFALEAYSYWQGNGPGFAIASTDFAHTVSWGGLAEATGTDGRDLTRSLSIVSQSGTQYLHDLSNIGGVPEPESWAMMLAGFGLLGAATRRRRARFGYAQVTS